MSTRGQGHSLTFDPGFSYILKYLFEKKQRVGGAVITIFHTEP